MEFGVFISKEKDTQSANITLVYLLKVYVLNLRKSL